MLSDKNKEAFKDLEIESRSLFADARIRFFKNRAALASLVVMGVIVLLVLFGQSFSHFSYEDTDWDMMQTAPSLVSGHYFGTDDLGRDLFVRTLQGGEDLSDGRDTRCAGRGGDRGALWRDRRVCRGED